MELRSALSVTGYVQPPKVGDAGRSQCTSAAPMTSDLDIYRTANVLIREHGEDAALEAAQRADAMLRPRRWVEAKVR